MKIAVGCLLLLTTLVQCRFMAGNLMRTFGGGSFYRTGAIDKCSGILGHDLTPYEECQIFVTEKASCRELYEALSSHFKPRRQAANHLLDINRCEPPSPSYRAHRTAPVCGKSTALRLREPFMNADRQKGRIVGGENTMNCTVIPWQVELHDPSNDLCGGSIISERHILTAAHCFLRLSKDPQLLEAIVGRYQMSVYKGWKQRVPVIDVAVHEGFDNNNLEHDIAILTLKDPLVFNECVAPICLDSTFLPDGHECIVSGWGEIRRAFLSSDELKMAKVEAFDGPKCEKQFKMKYIEQHKRQKDTLLCAGYIEGGRDACRGDSGGPLVCWHKGHYVQAGLVSYGRGCGWRNEPGFYSKVAYYKDWIQSKTGIQF